jgi:DJ-1/PfpI family/Uncharacterized conserved protein (DUF2267)
VPQPHGRAVAVLAAHGVDEAELTGAIRALRARGVTVRVLAPHGGPVRTVRGEGELGSTCQADEVVKDSSASWAVASYDALVLPGAVVKPDQEELGAPGSQFVRDFTVTGKPVAVLAEGPWTEVVRDALVEPVSPGNEKDRLLVVDRRPVEVDPGPGLAEFCELLVKSLSTLHRRDPLRADPRDRDPGGRRALTDSDEEFLRVVAQRAGLTIGPDTERLVRAVFGVLAEQLDRITADAVAARLPSGLRHVVRTTVAVPIPTQRTGDTAHTSTMRECGPGTTERSRWQHPANH